MCDAIVTIRSKNKSNARCEAFSLTQQNTMHASKNAIFEDFASNHEIDEQDFDSIEDSHSSKLISILSEINSNIDQNECVLINILRLNAIMLKNIDRLSRMILQSIKYLRIDSDSINWVKIITRIVWSRSRQAICCRQVVITRSSSANHEWIEYQTLDCIIANKTRDYQVLRE